MNVPQTKYKAVMVASSNWPYITKLTVCAAAIKAVHTENTSKMNLSIESFSVDRDSWCVTPCVTLRDTMCDTTINDVSC